MTDVHVYISGLVHCSVCAPKDLPREEVERQTNIENMTGIESQWKISDEPFAGGQQNPSPCERDPERLHYLMVC